jgi:hypothetical protein
MRFAYMLRGWGRSLWRYQFGVYWR